MIVLRKGFPFKVENAFKNNRTIKIPSKPKENKIVKVKSLATNQDQNGKVEVNLHYLPMAS